MRRLFPIKKPLALVLAAFFISSSLGPVAHGEESCSPRVIRDQTIVPDIPPYRSQFDRGFCYAFAAMTLLQRHYCRAKGGCEYVQDILNNPERMAQYPNPLMSGRMPSMEEMSRFFRSIPDDQLSVLDFIRRTRNDRILEGGAGIDTLRSISAEGRVAREHCAPYEDLKISALRRFGGSIDAWDSLLDQYDRFRGDLRGAGHLVVADEVCSTVATVRDLIPFPTEFEQILRALREESSERFIARALIPEVCRANAVPIPPFQVHTLPNRPLSREELSTRIVSLLDRSIPVMASHCSRPSGDSQRPCRGWHANVIVGRRQVCCGEGAGRCHWELKLADSANPRLDYDYIDAQPEGTLIDLNGPQHGWANADEFLDRILMNRHRPNWEYHLGWIE